MLGKKFYLHLELAPDLYLLPYLLFVAYECLSFNFTFDWWGGPVANKK